ncbi:hypothetical protein [Spartinivicinus poritis]|uniref:Uncharacterized protein n=1 Tax=Spartinivicinus poritis TaxID=2994640 RepID=A0ABT5U9R2_9GAMM|nr:hypothetical protein [Spartinivicinus sp. A2-2]MDE1463115.1 hypothetical protein [Spartinivicinus sp. A2-2]
MLRRGGNNTIYFGSVLALKDQLRDVERGMKTGLNAALKGKQPVIFGKINYQMK